MNQPNPAQQASDAISRENKKWAAACDPIHRIVSSLFDQHCPQGKWLTGPTTLVNAITAELAARELTATECNEGATAAQGVGHPALQVPCRHCGVIGMCPRPLACITASNQEATLSQPIEPQGVWTHEMIADAELRGLGLYHRFNCEPQGAE